LNKIIWSWKYSHKNSFHSVFFTRPPYNVFILNVSAGSQTFIISNSYKKEGKSTANFECLYSVKFHEKSLLHQQKQKHEKEVWKNIYVGKKEENGSHTYCSHPTVWPWNRSLNSFHVVLLLYCPFSYECKFRLFFYYLVNIAKSYSTSIN